MDVSSTQNGGFPPGPYREYSAELLRSNREKLRELRDSLMQLSEERADRGKDLRDEAMEARIQAVRQRTADQGPLPVPGSSEPAGDRIEISEQGRALAKEGAAESRPAPEDEAARAERLAEIRDRLERGSLNTPETRERAAARMLGAEA